MTEFKLPLFPVDSTAVSVTMTVWMGVCVVVFFNLRFGWTLSGLVVPGYLVPLLLVRPVAVAIIFGQAVLTYLVVRLLSDSCARLPCWSSFFGRDRFFAIVLVSVLVRAATDGWLLPAAGQWCHDALGIQIDYHNDLHSVGLIIVSLLANYFWKPRLFRGIVTSAITIGLTYALVKYVLLNVTNFSLGGLHYLYEDVSTSLLSSPKAYVVVITTAFTASWLNLRYSWDFNGILVPALLGLLWHEPEKIAVSIAESLWVLLLASQVLRLPICGRVTIEGGRKLLLFFTVAAAHRLALTHLLLWLGDFHITDAYGFGYLLTTLMAVKAHDKKIALRVCRGTLQASMLGAVAASFLGFTLASLPAHRLHHPSRLSALGDDVGIQSEDSTLWQVLNSQCVRLHGTKLPGSYQPVLPHKRDYFRDGILAALRYIDRGHSNDLQQAADFLAQANYRLRLVQHRYLVLTESDPAHGWGTFVLNQQASNELLIEVPAPLEESATIEAGLVLFQELQGRALAIAGAARQTGDDRSSDVLRHRNSMLATFHRVLDRGDALQVRGYTRELLTATKRWNAAQAEHALDSVSSSLHVKHALPPSLNLVSLKQIVPAAEIRWDSTPWANVLRDETSRGFAELVLNRQDRRRLRQRAVSVERDLEHVVQHEDAYLSRWLRDDRLTLARQGSNQYQPAMVAEMLYLDEEVVQPLVRLARTVSSFQRLSAGELDHARSIGAAASVLNYRLLLFHDQAGSGDYLVLTEALPKQRHWGTFVLRAGMNSPFLIEVPRPLYEQQTHQYGSALLQRLDAAGLLIAGAHPFANEDGTSDVARLANKVNAYQLVRQVILRELGPEAMLVVQTRAIQAPVDADLVVATDDGAATTEQLSAPVRELVQRLTSDGLKTRLVDGSEDTAGYELGLLLQAASLNQAVNKQMVTLWLSPSLRRNYRDPVFLELARSKFQALGIPTVHHELYEYLASLNVAISDAELDPAAVAAIDNYRQNGDIMRLHQIRQRWPEYRCVYLLDAGSDQSFLLVQPTDQGLPWIFNVDQSQSSRRDTLDSLTPDAVRRFVRSRDFLLQWKVAP